MSNTNSTVADVDTEATTKSGEELASRLPDPKGYQILVIKPTIEEKTAGGIIKPSEVIRKEEAGAVVGLVLKMGDMAYQDTARFPTGPWCRNGDFVLIGAYRGIRFTCDGKEFILINDDQILGTVSDPRGINRAY